MHSQIDERPLTALGANRAPPALWGLPERAAAGTALAGTLLHQVLDALAHGLVLVDAELQVLHANPAALLLVQAGAPMALVDGRVQGADALMDQQLRDAVRQAGQAQWAMLSLGQDGVSQAVGVVPMVADASCPHAVALLVLGSAVDLSGLAMQFFCQQHQLTPKESRVLAGLREGLSPEDIAQQNRVALCTVRTQIHSVRDKVRVPSIRMLLRRLMALPAMMGANPSRPVRPWR